jgi:hypothetical protein
MKKEAVKALREAKGRERAEKERGGEQEIAICVLRAQSDTLSIRDFLKSYKYLRAKKNWSSKSYFDAMENAPL